MSKPGKNSSRKAQSVRRPARPLPGQPALCAAGELDGEADGAGSGGLAAGVRGQGWRRRMKTPTGGSGDRRAGRCSMGKSIL